VSHDLNFEHYPEDIPASPRKYLRTYFPLFAEKASRILTVSNFSKQDLIDTYKVSSEKIDVAYNGVAPFFKPISSGEKDVVKNDLTNGADYYVFVGSLHPRKNLSRLLEAFDLFKEQDKGNFKLVVVGASLWGDSFGKELMERVKYKNDIVFTGHVSSNDLHKTIASAYAMTFVSYFEGFGIPVAEAMTCGVPVILSNKTSLPEVGGDVAIYVDPFDENEIAKAMIDIANDAENRKSLGIKSLKQGQKFTWDKSAEGLWASFEKMMSL
jgi:glycosyltransferase involved in cell wall biosynthesis